MGRTTKRPCNSTWTTEPSTDWGQVMLFQTWKKCQLIASKLDFRTSMMQVAVFDAEDSTGLDEASLSQDGKIVP